MAATNYTPIQLYRTTTLAAAPVSGNLTSGELAINVNDADMALYAKNNTGNVKRLMNNPAGLKYPTADGTANQVIKTDGAGTLSFSTPTTGTVTSVGGTGTVSGITLTGTVTSSGSLTLGGTLSLASPPTIGNTTANTGAFTTLSASGQLTLTKATNYNLYASGAGNNYMAGSLGIGNTTLTNFNLNVQKNLTGSTTATNISSTPNIQSDVTAQADGYSTFISTATAAFTLTGLTHYRSSQGPFGAGSTVAIQRGFFAQSDLIGATNNYGFHSNIPAGTGRYNLYMSGTADNYLAGSLGIGFVPTPGNTLEISKVLTGASVAVTVSARLNPDATVTSGAYCFASHAINEVGASTPTIYHYNASQGAFAGTAPTNQYGFNAAATLTGATNNHGFQGNIASGIGRYNLYMSGTAANYLAGDLQLGKVITATGTNGAQTINTTTGSVNFAIAATSLVVTNSLVTANSIIIATVASNDTTMKSVQVVAAAGSFTLYASAAATAATRVNFLITN
jgi:hypothetical protein